MDIKLIVDKYDSSVVEILCKNVKRTTREALECSIDKWKIIVALVSGGYDVSDNGFMSCGLCHKYYDRQCKGCPVKLKTGLADCEGTPYDKWHDTPTLAVAKAELAFLESLRTR